MLMSVDLPTFGETDQADVRDDLQFQLEVHILAGQAGLWRTWGSGGSGWQSGCCPSRRGHPWPRPPVRSGQVSHDKVGLGLLQHSTAGTRMTRSSPSAPLMRLARPFSPSGAVYFALIAEVHQGGQVVVRHKDDITAAAAIAAVRAARRHKFFAVERHRTVAALAWRAARSWRYQ